MEEKHCPKCASLIPESAKVCPRCSRNIGAWGWFLNFAAVSGVLVSLFGAGAAWLGFYQTSVTANEVKVVLERAEANTMEIAAQRFLRLYADAAACNPGKLRCAGAFLPVSAAAVELLGLSERIESEPVDGWMRICRAMRITSELLPAGFGDRAEQIETRLKELPCSEFQNN